MHAMHRTNAELADLNLLRVFLAIWDLRSLTAAGERLGLSQPAVSHALRRLRTHFDDPLFVRNNTEMLPTAAAIRLHGPLDTAFNIIHGAMQHHGRFEPSTAERTFRVCMSDMSEYYFLPPLLAALEHHAPAVRFSIVQHPVETLAGAMRAGEIDLAVGYLPGIGEGCPAVRLFADEHVCVVRTGHPLAERVPTRTALAHLRYVFAETSATGHRRVEQWLANEGLERDIVLRLPHFTIAPEIVRNTDLAVILPRSIAAHFNRGREDFRLLPLPFALPAIDVSVYVHERFAADPGIAWLRDTFIATFAHD